MSGYYSNTRMDLGVQAQLSDTSLQDELDQIYIALRTLHLALVEYEAPVSIDLDNVSGRALLDFYGLNSGSRLILEADSAIAPGDFVGPSASAGKIERIFSRGPSYYNYCSFGWAITGGVAGEPVILYANPAIIPFFSGLLPGRTYFITESKVLYPSVGDLWTLPVGFALNSTTLKLYTGVTVYEWQ